jgi:hypothetical protein
MDSRLTQIPPLNVSRKDKNLIKIVQVNKPLQAQIETLLVLDIFHNFMVDQKYNASDVGSASVIR